MKGKYRKWRTYSFFKKCQIYGGFFVEWDDLEWPPSPTIVCRCFNLLKCFVWRRFSSFVPPIFACKLNIIILLLFEVMMSVSVLTWLIVFLPPDSISHITTPNDHLKRNRIPEVITSSRSLVVITKGSNVGVLVRALASHLCYPGSVPVVGMWLSLLLVLSSLRGFFLGFSVFLPPYKPTLPNSNSTWTSSVYTWDPGSGD